MPPPHTKRPHEAMAQLGDPEYRPQETSAVAATNGALDEASLHYSAHAVVACRFLDRDDIDTRPSQEGNLLPVGGPRRRRQGGAPQD